MGYGMGCRVKKHCVLVEIGKSWNEIVAWMICCIDCFYFQFGFYIMLWPSIAIKYYDGWILQCTMYTVHKVFFVCRMENGLLLLLLLADVCVYGLKKLAAAICRWEPSIPFNTNHSVLFVLSFGRSVGRSVGVCKKQFFWSGRVVNRRKLDKMADTIHLENDRLFTYTEKHSFGNGFPDGTIKPIDIFQFRMTVWIGKRICMRLALKMTYIS